MALRLMSGPLLLFKQAGGRLDFSCCLLSNNKEPRVKMFNEKIGVSYIFKAGKPGKNGYEQAMRKIGTNKKNDGFHW